MSIRSLPVLGLAQSAKPQGKSLAVIPRSVDNGCMIEIHVRYHRRHSSEIVKLRPITKARQVAEETKARQIAEETKSRFFLATQD